MLSCYRVLDLTDEKGFFCGKILGDIGTDVIKIEKPFGDEARQRGPFFHDIPDPEKSLYWFAFNNNKKGITLNIEKADGQELFKELVKTADVVVESFAPGYMDKLGLGYSALTQINPGLIMTSITAFGQEGPFKDFKGPDIVVHALSGLLYSVGDADRCPIVPSYPHAYLISAMYGAIGTLVVLYDRHWTGRGQRIDVSTQQALAWVTSVEFQAPWAMFRQIPKRLGSKRFPRQIKTGEIIYHPVIWRCKDGFISFTLITGAAGEKGNRRLVEWMKNEGIDPGPLGRWNWKTMDWTSIETKEEAEKIFEILQRFFLRHNKYDLFEEGIRMGIHIGPLLTFEEMLKFPQLIQRGFWTDIKHDELGATVTFPGGFVKLTQGICGIRCRAPLIGEHNTEIYKNELKLSDKDLVDLKQRGVI